jgi:hypothetical protein
VEDALWLVINRWLDQHLLSPRVTDRDPLEALLKIPSDSGVELRLLHAHQIRHRLQEAGFQNLGTYAVLCAGDPAWTTQAVLAHDARRESTGAGSGTAGPAGDGHMD